MDYELEIELDDLGNDDWQATIFANVNSGDVPEIISNTVSENGEERIIEVDFASGEPGSERKMVISNVFPAGAAEVSVTANLVHQSTVAASTKGDYDDFR